MEFAILGPLRIGGPGGVIRIGAPKQSALLAALLLAYRDDGVSSARLIDMLSNLGVLAVYAGDDEEAIRRYEHAAAIARDLGDERTLALLLQNLGLVHAGAGRQDPPSRCTRKASWPPRRPGIPRWCSRSSVASRGCGRGRRAAHRRRRGAPTGRSGVRRAH